MGPGSVAGVSRSRSDEIHVLLVGTGGGSELMLKVVSCRDRPIGAHQPSARPITINATGSTVSTLLSSFTAPPKTRSMSTKMPSSKPAINPRIGRPRFKTVRLSLG
jgi:hypothetical protein